MRVDVYLSDFIVNDTYLLRVLQATHSIVIFQDLIESGAFIDKDVNSLVARKLNFLFSLLLHLLL